MVSNNSNSNNNNNNNKNNNNNNNNNKNNDNSNDNNNNSNNNNNNLLNHLLFMDDLKLSSKSEEQMDTLVVFRDGEWNEKMWNSYHEETESS